jgi:hypothetical protein
MLIEFVRKPKTSFIKIKNRDTVIEISAVCSFLSLLLLFK